MVAAALAGAAAWAGAARAEYPEKEIRVVVGFPPGSVIELSGRAIMQVAEKYIRKPLVILNKPGAAQSIAMNELVGSPADGYTIAVSTDGYKATTRHTQVLAFDPEKIRYVAGYARFQHVLFVKGHSAYGTYDKFVALARREPKKIEWAGSGVGAAPQLLGEVFFRDLKIPATYVPFKGSNEYVQAVMGGQVLSGVIDFSGVAQYVKTGALDLVAVLADKRLEEFPDVPTAREKGLSELDILNGNIVVVTHADVPPDRFAFLVDAFRKAADDPEFKAMAKKMRLNVVYTPPSRMEEQAKKTGALTLPLIKELGLYKK
jgi:tripartite-type tricarboxylate transporter receptor subunit TctC